MLEQFIPIIIVLLVSLTMHEYAHGWVAFRCGDPTAKLMGRLTLNPLKHIDPFATIALPIILTAMGFYPLGGAKPVPVNFTRLNNPKRDMALVAVAGPFINLCIVFVFLTLQKIGLVHEALQGIVQLIILINFILAVFNMIPIPPLDGSRVIMGVLPKSIGSVYAKIEPIGIILLLILLQFDFFRDLLGYFILICAKGLGISL